MAKKHSVISELDERLDDIRKQSGAGNDNNEDEELDAEDEDLEDDDESEEEDDGKDSSRKSKTDDDEEEEESDDKPGKKGKKEEEDESEADDEDDEEDSDDDDSDEDEDDDDDSAPGRITPKQYKNLRSQKRASDANAKALLDLIGATSVEEATAKLAEMKTSAAPSTEFLDAAKELGIEDPENVQKLFSLFKTTIEKDVVEGKVKPMEKQMGDLMDAVAPILSAQAVEKEWSEFVPQLEETFPDASRAQLKEARKLMTDLAQTEKYTNSKMDFILFKELDQFEDIIGPPKRRTMLPSRARPDAPVEKKSKSGLPDIDSTSHDSIINARKQMKRIQSREGLREDDGMEI